MDPKVRKQAADRLARAEGHLRKVIEMLKEGAYCPDVIHQSQAVQAALKKTDEVILESHLHSCVLHNIKNGGTNKKKLASEIMEVFKKTT